MIVIISYENYPDGSPGAIRNKAFAEAYAKMGYDVTVIHKGEYTTTDNPSVVSLFHSNKYIKYFSFGRKVISKLIQIKSESTIEAIICYSSVGQTLLNWCKKNDIPCICDVVEWFSKEQFSKWFLNRAYWEKERSIKRLAKSRVRIIAISSYLMDFFKENGCKAVRIPMIHNYDCFGNSSLKAEDFSVIRIIYAGSHLLMDNIPLLLRSISRIDASERKRIQLAIYGLSFDQISAVVGQELITQLGDSVVIKGRRSNAEILEAYKNSHFSVLLRDPCLRVNKAGFPSKMVESMRMGVPLICNLSSDMGFYLSQENSVIVGKLYEESIVESFHSILSMQPSQYVELRNNAIATVRAKLHAKQFETQFKEIIQK